MSDAPRSEAELSTTAFHEAGHAVVGVRYGFALLSASVVPDPVSHGRCQWGDALTGLKGIEVYAAAFQSVESFRSARNLGPDTTTELQSDDERVWLIALELAPGGDLEAAQHTIILPAHERVAGYFESDDFRRGVEAVADALLQRGTLTGHEVAAIVAGKGTESPS